MKKEIYISGRYLNIPVIPGADEQQVDFYQIKGNGEEAVQVMSFLIPVDEDMEEYTGMYTTQLVVQKYMGSTLILDGEFTQAFADAITVGNDTLLQASTEQRPSIHLTADTGWTNDPNGLVYADGVYHFYYQYNPFNLEWNNMSWGHAVSKDLLHWEQKDSVMYPDHHGTIYSGCGIINERGLLGLPKDALIFFYTAAGGVNEWSQGLEFTQKIAYSLDGGKTLQKMEEPCVPTLYKDSRDPKVFWHEESQAYIMVLWTKGNDFGILRSTDLKNWELTEEVTLEDGWECPDLFRLYTEDGESCWFFWAADGYYYVGDFDGYHFKTDGKKKRAYLSGLPYAAQTYHGIDGKVISVPWLRMRNDGRKFTSSYGIPMEFYAEKTEEGFWLMQKPIDALMENAYPVSQNYPVDARGIIKVKKREGQKGTIIRARMRKGASEYLRWKINGSTIQYVPAAGRLIVDKQGYHVAKNQRDIMFLVDDRILEVYFKEKAMAGIFELNDYHTSLQINVNEVQGYEIYEID